MNFPTVPKCHAWHGLVSAVTQRRPVAVRDGAFAVLSAIPRPDMSWVVVGGGQRVEVLASQDVLVGVEAGKRAALRAYGPTRGIEEAA